LTVALFFQLQETRKEVKGWNDAAYASDLLDRMARLKKISDPQDVILCTWTLGHQVATYAQRKVIATSKVYPSQMNEIAERYIDIANFFFAQDEDDAMDIIRKYNAKFVIHDTNFEFWICRYNNTCHLREKSRPEPLTEEGEKTTMIGKMLYGTAPEYLRIVDSSPHFQIYRVVE